MNWLDWALVYLICGVGAFLAVFWLDLWLAR